MAEAGIHWQVPPEQAWPELAEAYVAAIHRGVLAVAQRWAPQVENWMKANAPWTDRTTAARRGLHTQIRQEVNDFVELLFLHGVFYGWYLEGINPETMEEMQNAGRWNIINPAIDHFGPRIWADVRRMLS